MLLARPTRRWLRFSIRRLLLLTLLVAIGCGWLRVQVLRGQEQDRIVAELEKYGVQASAYKATIIGRTLRKISPSYAWGERTMGRGALIEVTEVEALMWDQDVQYTEIVQRLRALPALSRIDVYPSAKIFQERLRTDFPTVVVAPNYNVGD